MRLSAFDCGEVQDFAAFISADVMLRPRSERPGQTEPYYLIDTLSRFDRGIGYLPQAAELNRRYAEQDFAGSPLGFDYTGKGDPILTIFQMSRINAWWKPITITGGGQWTIQDNGHYHVAKSILASAAISVSEGQRYKIAGSLKYRTVLEAEMQAFTKKLSKAGNEQFEAAKGGHDDLCLAFCMLCFLGEHTPLVASFGLGGKLPEPPKGAFGTGKKADPYAEDGMLDGRDDYGLPGGVPSNW